MARELEDAGFAWAELVSDGHVRSARLRWMQPWLIALGGLALIIGFYIQAGVRIPIRTQAEMSLYKQVRNIQAPLKRATKSLPEVSIPESEAIKLVPSKELVRSIVPIILASLNRTGRLPTDKIEIRSVSVDDFWFKLWPTDSLVTIGNDDIRLVGAIVNYSDLSYNGIVGPARWIGVFRKKDGVWRERTGDVEDDHTYGVLPGPGIRLDDIPVTLKPFVPESCFLNSPPCKSIPNEDNP